MSNVKSKMLQLAGSTQRMGHVVVHSWLTHCATRWKVAGSIPDGVIEIFYWHNPSGRNTVLELTQPLTEMSTKNITWG
jgi:elongation factor P hydroxylase